jgi:DNA polymerase-4
MVNWEAKRLCPDLILVPPQYEQYLKYSNMAREIYQEYTDLVEPYGMDECFLDVTASQVLYGSGKEIADQIRCRMKNELGLTVSIGISFNKIFAKLGSDMKKPDAITSIEESEWKQKVWPLRVSELLFCGRSTTKKLEQVGIYTIGDLAEMDHDYVNQLLGKNGLMLWSYANGLDDSPVMEKDFVSPMKSVGHGITCTADLKTEEEVWKVILELCQDIGHRLRIHGLKAQGVQIAIRSQELFIRQYQGQLSLPTIVPLEIAKLARELFQRNYDWKEPVRSVTVRAINLVSAKEPEQICLFSDPIRLEKEEKLFLAIEEIRRRFGKRAIYPAALMKDLKMPEYRDHGLIMPGVMNR